MKLNTLRFFSLIFTTAVAIFVIVFGDKLGIEVSTDFVIKVLLIIALPNAINRNKGK